MSFSKIKKQVRDNFEKLALNKDVIFYKYIDRDKIYDLYLDGFVDPAERQGHTCSCCKSFLRQYGGIVIINSDYTVSSIWDIEDVDELYDASISMIHDYIKSLPIHTIFLNSFKKLGTDKNHDLKDLDKVWNHFYLELDKKFIKTSGDSIASVQGTRRDVKSVFKRGLDELTDESFDIILDLIAQNSLYKGREYEAIIKSFYDLKKEYQKIPDELKDAYCWVKSNQISESISKIRGHAIGTLLVDISEDMEINEACEKFGKKVDPFTYKRPTAEISSIKKVKELEKMIGDLGFSKSLERRFAASDDISINDLIFIDKSSDLKSVFDGMSKDIAINPKTFKKIEEITLLDFIHNVIPNSKSVELFLENQHLPNFVSLITSADKNSPSMFKWDNSFSWAYTGGITDSIKERVKQAGGNVNGVLRVSLSWSNYDDLDLYVTEPNGNEIFFQNKGVTHESSAKLDVDANGGSAQTRTPVENITWTNLSLIQEGRHKVRVNNYQGRESEDTGYVVQMEFNGESFEFPHAKNPSTKSTDNIIEFHYSKANGIRFDAEVKSNVSPKEKWELKTYQFHKVKSLMLSPNYWGMPVGNKHYIFSLEGCNSDEETRPFFNEFLKEDFMVYKREMEVLGSRLLIKPVKNQISGIGFSDTQRSSVIVRVKGSFERLLRILI